MRRRPWLRTPDSTLYVDAPGIDLTGLPAGTAVTLSHRWSVLWGCTETVLMAVPKTPCASGMGETHDVFMGQTEEPTWTSGSAPETWRVRNLRSFETGYCDDYWNWAYWTVRVAAP